MPTKAKSRARRRSAKPRTPYPRAAMPERLGDERLRFTLIGKKGSRPVGDAITAVRWDDTGMELTGTLEGQAPLRELEFHDGDRVRCEWAPTADAPFRRLWTLALTAGSGEGISRTLEADATSGTLASTLGRYRAMTMDFSYRKDKRHPHGWTADQIARDVAKRVGMPLGKIARGTHRIKNLVRRNADPVDVILVAYRQEREATGRRFFAAWAGRLNMTVLTRSRYLLELLPVLLSGEYTERRRSDFATVLDVRVSAKAGKKTKKIKTRVTDKAGVKQYGQVVRSESPKNVDSVAEARKWGRANLQQRQAAKRELTITVPLMPLIRRGDALRVNVPSEPDLRQIVFVRSAAHEWTAGQGQTTLVVRFDDPFVDKRAAKSSKAKSEKARKRGKKAPKSATKVKPPAPKKAARRK
jgi:hypothetical protein